MQPALAADPASRDRIRTWLARPSVQVAALLLLAALAYANAVAHPFVYDDLPLVLHNPQIRSLDNLPQMVVSTDEGFRLRTRWTRFVSHALEYAVAGSWAPLYHATNIALHGAVGVLVFLLIFRISASRALSWWSAALFLVHPINTEVVAHVAGRRGLLAALFSLLALVLLVDYDRRGGRWRAVGASAALFLGAFSKETAVLTPLAFVLLDGWLRLRSLDARRPLVARLGQLARARWALYGALGLYTLGVTAWFFAGGVVTPHEGFYDTTGGGLGMLDRAGILGLALRLLVLPLGQSVDYSFDALGVLHGGRALLALDLTLLALGLAAWAATLWRRSWAAWTGAWMLLYFLPHVGLVAWHEVFAERFLYLPSIGFAVAVAAAGLAAARRPARRQGMLATAAIALALLGAATLARNRVWSSPRALWSDAVARYPDCARARKALGDVYLRDLRPELALEQYSAAARLVPGYVDARVGVAVAQSAQGDYGKALRTLDEVLQRWPTAPRALNLKGFIHQTFGENDAAIAAYRAAVESDPGFADGYNNLARLYVERGDTDTAVRLYEQALARDPGLVVAWKNLAAVYRHAYHDEERALRCEREAARLDAVTR